jgi:hypothetical protein
MSAKTYKGIVTTGASSTSSDTHNFLIFCNLYLRYSKSTSSLRAGLILSTWSQCTNTAYFNIHALCSSYPPLILVVAMRLRGTERTVVCLFGTVIMTTDENWDRTYKNYLQYTKEAHILVIIRNYKQKWKNKSYHRNPKLLHHYKERE